MPPLILGLSAFYHDSAAAIVRGGTIVAAAEEERFSRRKHDARFPRHAVNYCLGAAQAEAEDLDAVVFYDNPALTLDRTVKNFIDVAPRGEEQWVAAVTSLLGAKAQLKGLLAAALGGPRDIWYVDHHLSHAASAFYPSPYETAAILTIDGVGEHATLALGLGTGNRIELLREIRYPHSLGLLYSAFTVYCGFKVNSGEYKLMGLAPYGRPLYADVIRDQLIDIRPDGSFRLNLDGFAFMHEGAMTNERFHALFGGPPRAPESRIELRHMDIAASIQAVTEEVVVALGREARRLTGARHLTMAGGVALNCVANGQLSRAGIFDDMWVQPAAGDAGGALGAALFAAHAGLGSPRRPAAGARDTQRGSRLGPAYSGHEVRAVLDRHACPYEVVADPQERARRIAEVLAGCGIVGHLAGRMEFGPRALGGRSILADPRRVDAQAVLNTRIKHRESFRPFAPAVLHDRAAEIFELSGESPYMLLVAPVREALRRPIDWGAFHEGGDADMLAIVNQPRSSLPAVTHVDYSARVQTVHPDDHPDFHAILTAFDRLTGCPALVNTSFNLRGEPIVNTPLDAYRCFMRTGIDLLVLEDCLLWKDRQPAWKEEHDWRDEFELD